MAKRLIPSLNGVLVEKLLQPKKSSGGILLPASTKQEGRIRAPINRLYGTTARPSSVPSNPGLHGNAKCLIPSLNRVLLQPKKSTGSILLPANAKQEGRIRAPINRFYGTTARPSSVPSNQGLHGNEEEEMKRELKWIWGFSVVAATFASICDELRPSKRASRREKRRERQRERKLQRLLIEQARGAV